MMLMTPADERFYSAQEVVLEYLIVFIGAGIGGALRHGVNVLSLSLFGMGFPYGTMSINIVGSILMGVVISLFAGSHLSGQETRLFLTTGILGGFTTFSTFSLETVTLWERGEEWAAVSYVLVSVIVSVIALGLTLYFMRKWI